jgi:hypothetical protein
MRFEPGKKICKSFSNLMEEEMKITRCKEMLRLNSFVICNLLKRLLPWGNG